MVPRRLVILGINYAPELTGIAPYTTEVAQHFAESGHIVRVVTGVPHYPGWRRQRIPPPSDQSNPEVVRYQHFVPRRANALGRMVYEASWLLSGSRSLLRGRADAVIGIVPSLSGGLLAVAAGRHWRVPVGIVIQDLMGPAAAQSGYRGGKQVAGVTRGLERFVIRKANQVAYISEGFRPYLQKAGASEASLHRVRAWTHPGRPTESIACCRARLGWLPGDFICLHAGNMGQKQELDIVLDAAARLSTTAGIRIVLAGDGNDRDRLVERSSRMGLSNVSFLGLQAPGQFEAMLRAADVLVLNQRSSVSDMSLPSKLAAYFSSGRPVVAAVARDSEAEEQVRAARAGVVVDAGNAEAMAAAIAALKGSSQEAATFGMSGKKYADAHLGPERALALYDEFLACLLEVENDAPWPRVPLGASREDIAR